MVRPLALTMGEPTGIGPELALKAWLHQHSEKLSPFLLYADPAFMRKSAHQLGWDIPIHEATPDTAADVFENALPVQALAVTVQHHDDPSMNAAAVIASIDDAVSDVVQGYARAIITNPIAKSYLMSKGFAFPGHTEYLAALAHQHGHPHSLPVMMLWCEELAVIPVTVHIPLRAVGEVLTTELIVQTARIAARSFQEWFGISHPRLAISGLNPHAGEDGLLGDEDNRIIKPALATLQAEGINATGPYPADTLFHSKARKTYDVALAMYHDQALIPIKTIAFDRGVNITLGLPFVRTSPDHGTAFDIAGKGCADISSLIEAIKLADRLTAKA